MTGCRFDFEFISKNILTKLDNPSDKRSFLVTFNQKENAALFKGMKLLKNLDTDLVKVLGKGNAKVVHNSLKQIIESYTNVHV